MNLPRLNPLPDSVQTGLLGFLHDTFRFHAPDWRPLLLNGLPLGMVNGIWQQRLLRDWPGSQQILSDGLLLQSDSWDDMARLLQQTARGWHDAGLFGGWRNETFDVCDSSGTALFALERAAFRPLGLHSKAVHINGLSPCADGWRFLIARRSPHKAVDPGKLDNLTGGGIAAGETPEAAMRREGREEAGLPPELLDTAAPAGRIISLHAVKRGLHRESLYLYDIILPDGFTPQNQDGEVSAFAAMDAHAVADAVIRGEMTNDAALVTLDLFRRCGLLSPQHPLTAYLRSTRLQTAV